MRNKLGFFPNKQCFITFNNHSRPGSGNHRRALFSWHPGRVSLPLFHGLFSQKAHRPTLGLSKPEAQPVQTRGTKGSSSITHWPLATPRNTNLIQRTVPVELHWLWGTTTKTLPWALQHLLTQRCQIFSCLHMLFFMHAWDLVLSPTSPHSPPTLLYAAALQQSCPALPDGFFPRSHQVWLVSHYPLVPRHKQPWANHHFIFIFSGTKQSISASHTFKISYQAT